MNKENLNDFYNLNRFNQKLRERVDSYEPELSDSLWDRIEHGLDRRENRSKRAIWMVYVLGALLLLSSAGVFYLWDQNKKLAEAGRQSLETINRQRAAQNAVPAPIPNISESVPQTTEPQAGSAETAAPQQPAGTENQAGTGNAVIPVNPVVPSEGPVETVTPSVVNYPFGEVNTAPVENTPVVALAVSSKEVPGFNLRNKTTPPNYLQLSSKRDKDIYPKVQPFVAVFSEVGSTRQRVGGPHAGKFGFEHPMLYNAQGIRFGVETRSGWSVSSGIGSSSSGSNLWYGLEKAKAVPDTVPVPQGADSVVAGSNYAFAKQYWIDIPLQVSYRYALTSAWSVTGTAGLTYSIINSYSGSEPDTSFIGLTRYGTEEPQPFKNYLSLQLGTGIAYQFAHNWQLSLEGQYRRGITDMNRVQSLTYPTRRADFIGGQLGLRYTFR